MASPHPEEATYVTYSQVFLQLLGSRVADACMTTNVVECYGCGPSPGSAPEITENTHANSLYSILEYNGIDIHSTVYKVVVIKPCMTCALSHVQHIECPNDPPAERLQRSHALMQ